ncbi:DUF1015 domain-containing protein [Carboxydothermus ferrireducens]|uniref:Uncharacterized protein (DUF1015 family) n=1 Tax=Carboxydothermus ferrireducens DSM 11255 TaxID=1119529 RepID=A0ABX2R720_9THEO|nr:DUF1015 domain-containing protein [Carboxydothermus ferrireducens]NYE56958.1 uncharacterized protein (DUF1015 family) [Carboxydothermus ferrireducens DSM 11255]
MAGIFAFRGIYYNPELFSQLPYLVTPPYDIISPEEQEKYYNEHEYNFIRLELGKTFADDTSENNRYTRAKSYLNNWLSEGILVQEETPALYLLEEIFSWKEQSYTRKSIFASVQVEPYEKGVILPHENTLPKAKEDRLNLLRETRVNTSPIMALYDDSQNLAFSILKEKASLMFEFTDESGRLNKFYKVVDPEALLKAQSYFKDQKLFIADGHHRYDTALTYAREMEKKGINAYRVLMQLIPFTDPGLLVLPTHRIVLKAQNSPAEILEKILAYFTFVEVPLKEILNRFATLKERYVFGMCLKDKAYLLYLKENDPARVLPGLPEVIARLPVTVLHELILKPAGIGENETLSGEYLKYTRNAQDCLTEVVESKAPYSFLVPAPTAEDVANVALSGNKMPQKSTYFYPKPLSGLVIHPVHD